MSKTHLITDPILRKYATHWLVEYYKLDANGKKTYPAVRVTDNINRIKDTAEREAAAISLINSIRAKFKMTRIKHLESLSDTPIGEALTLVAKTMCENTNKKRTQETINDMTNSFLKYLKSENLEKIACKDLAYSDVENYFDALHQKRKRNGERLSNRTINNHRNNLRWIFFKLQAKGYITKNYFPEVKKEKEGEKQNRAFQNFERDIVFPYIHETDPILAFAVTLIYRCGIRSREELHSLRPSNFDLKLQIIRIKGEISKSNGADQFVTIPTDIVEYVNKFLENIPKNWFIFGAGKGIEPHPTKTVGRNSLYERHKKILKELEEQGEIPTASGLTLYTWKHTGADNLLEEGIDILTLRDHLRHKDIRTTNEYLRSRPKVLNKIKNIPIGPKV